MVIEFLKKDRKLLWMITIIIALAIFYISSISFEMSSGLNQKLHILPILYHILAFFFLALFFLFSVKTKNKKMLIVLNVILILYALLDEIHQLFVPGRFFALLDIISDAVGIFLANIIYLKFRH